MHAQHTPWFFIEMRHVKRIQQGIYKWNFICFFPSMLFIIFTRFFLSSIHPCFGCSIFREKNIPKIINSKFEPTKYEAKWNEMKRKGSTPAAFVVFICLWIECVICTDFIQSCWFSFRVCSQSMMARILLLQCTCSVYLSWLTGAFGMKVLIYYSTTLQYRRHHCVCITISSQHSSQSSSLHRFFSCLFLNKTSKKNNKTTFNNTIARMLFDFKITTAIFSTLAPSLYFTFGLWLCVVDSDHIEGQSVHTE